MLIRSFVQRGLMPMRLRPATVSSGASSLTTFAGNSLLVQAQSQAQRSLSSRLDKLHPLLAQR